MKILVIGATGFIGKAIYQTLKQSSDEVIASTREFIDFTVLQNDKELVNKLQSFDIVVNTVGIIAETKTESFEQMHTIAPITLFDACKEAGVKKVIHISALGSENGTTAYHTSKNRADEYLRQSGLEYAILHPSIVYGDDGKSTALFQGLATLPLTPIVGDGSQLLQPICIEDLVATVQKFIESDDKKIELNVVGEEPVTYKELLEIFRGWLGHKPTKSVSVPTIGTNVLGKILEEPTVNHDNIIMLNEGSSASVKPLADFLGFSPVGIKENLGNKEAHYAQKLYASLYLLRPLLRIVIGFVWIWSGIVSAFLYPQPLALELLHEIGIGEGISIYVLYVASFLDVVLGVLTIIGYRLQALLALQILVILVYTLLLTALAPYHWLHPFGAVLKNLPLMLGIFVLMKLERYR
ncbi:MAG TPA: SDR family oxidoreductase [Sulfurospirillum arcachonense]|nr:SDR family oxidoreductase [Sulfurospirillum arcachonense]HIP41655.1 SDR family oxidoreductase [Campylobacterales bacterium]